MVEALRRIANNGEMNSSGDWNIKTIDGDLRVVHVGYSYTSDRHDMSIRMLVEDFWSVIEGGTKSPITFNSTLIIFKYDGSRHMSLTDEDVDCIANLIIDMDVGWSGAVANECERKMLELGYKRLVNDFGAVLFALRQYQKPSE
jgi:hypothetical protein